MSEISDRIANLSSAKKELLMGLVAKEAGRGSRSQTIPRRATGDSEAPLSFAQERLWFLEKLEPETPAYNIPIAISLSGKFNIAAFEQSLDEIVRRQASLRTSFGMVDGRPVQFIAKNSKLPLQVIDLRDLPEPNRAEEAFRLGREEAKKPFALNVGPLIRVTLLRLGEDRYLAVLVIHHLVSDGWSISVLVNEIGIIYAAHSKGGASPLPDLPIQYADFAAWHRQWLQGEVLQRQLSYWKRQLSGSPEVLALPTDRPRPQNQTFRGAMPQFRLSRELSDQVKSFSHSENITLFMTMLAAFFVLLHRYTGQDDILVGTPVANRDREEIEGLIGCFVNTIVLRINLSHNPSFREVCKRVRDATIGASPHQHLPFDLLVKELRIKRRPSYHPLFQVFFRGDPPARPLQDSSLILSHEDIDNASSKFDIVWIITDPGDGLVAYLNYNTDLFNADTIDRMWKHHEALLEEVIRNPDQRLLDIPIDRREQDKSGDPNIDFGNKDQFVFE